MLRDDEELRGPSCRTKGHIEVKKHTGMRSLCCSTLNLFCRQLPKQVPKTSKGLSVGKMRQNKFKSEKGNLKKKICCAFLHKHMSY